MIRQIITIDSKKCNGCGICVKACHEGAIAMVDGKAKLIRDDYCDGLGNCLPACPTRAITFVEREAKAFDEAAVKKHMESKQETKLGCGCPSTTTMTFDKNIKSGVQTKSGADSCQSTVQSELRQFPIQIKLVSAIAPYFDGCDLLIAADCTAFAYGNFHQEYIKGKITLIGCPKLDDGDYSSKLTEILTENNINSLTVVRMEVPCCSGIVETVKTALKNSGKIIPWQIIMISRSGQIVK